MMVISVLAEVSDARNVELGTMVVRQTDSALYEACQRCAQRGVDVLEELPLTLAIQRFQKELLGTSRAASRLRRRERRRYERSAV